MKPLMISIHNPPDCIHANKISVMKIKNLLFFLQDFLVKIVLTMSMIVTEVVKMEDCVLISSMVSYVTVLL
jgi:hypothetical protein